MLILGEKNQMSSAICEDLLRKDALFSCLAVTSLWSTAYNLERFGTERARNAGMDGNADMRLGNCRNTE